MNILLTGASGMVGKNILAFIPSEEYEFHCPSKNQLNLLDYQALKKYINQIRPDAIIHCAGLVGGIHANVTHPFDFAYTNAMLGLNLVKAALDCKVERVLNLGSSCMYPRNAGNPLKEEQILTGELEPTNEGYALAKILTAKLCDYANAQYGANFKTLIPCNLYGFWDNFDPAYAHMIPAVIRKIHEAKKNKKSEVLIWGDGASRREFLFAKDFADFVFFALENFTRLNDVTNVGLGRDYSILEYYQIIASVIGLETDYLFDLSKPAGMKQKLVDTSLTRGLGWSAKTNLRDGIAQTYQFFLREYS